ncbi:MAG TPA: STAS-like domain-containing protein [Thermoguttaceae bacterium]|nr:STAS-like domain-containing protein [Thermoguttaceae bacterium]
MPQAGHATPTLHLSEFGTVLVTRDQGEPVRMQLMGLLQTHSEVEVNLDDVEAYTPSFMDEVLGKCLEAIGLEEFRKKVTLVASAPEVRKLVNLILSNRAAARSS